MGHFFNGESSTLRLIAEGEMLLIFCCIIKLILRGLKRIFKRVKLYELNLNP